jgi:hypothetical protein
MNSVRKLPIGEHANEVIRYGPDRKPVNRKKVRSREVARPEGSEKKGNGKGEKYWAS